MISLKKIFIDNRKISDDNILSIFKSINYQVKLVDVVCKRDIKTYKNNNQKIISLMNSDWVFGYIFGFSTNYFSNIKIDIEKNIDLYTGIISDVLHMLRINSSKKSTDHKERIDSFLHNKLYEKKNTDLHKGFQIGMYDYSNFLKISKNKKKIDKILMYMELCHYLCDELNIPRINEKYPTD